MRSRGNAELRLLLVSCGTLLVVLLTLVAVPGVTGSVQYGDASSERKAHYCGAKLSDTLAQLCKKFNGFRKKSGNMPMPYPEQRLLDGVQGDVEELRELQDRSTNLIQQALMTLQHLNSHEHGFRRVRRQVVAECCYQSCTLDTLKKYCAD
uniref:Insulin-like domain-containing protein n=1 Tax=Anopheles farauti TaxID=69004 RepID=A0A182QN24_9DIPT